MNEDKEQYSDVVKKRGHLVSLGSHFLHAQRGLITVKAALLFAQFPAGTEQEL